jgi:hypothetical protein
MRWPPRQRVQVSETGKAAVEAYQALVVSARSAGQVPGALEASLATWASERGIRPADGVLLEELTKGKLTVSDLARAVEDCGLRASDVKAGIDRLYGAALVEPPEAKPLMPPSSPYRLY